MKLTYPLLGARFNGNQVFRSHRRSITQRERVVVNRPGHSPGAVALLDHDNRVLFTGDHFFPGPLYCHADDVEIERNVASNKKLADMVDLYDYVLSGHNDP